MQYQKLINQGFIYLYRGDRYTDSRYKLQPCYPVLSSTGKCIRGKNGNMLVSFQSGTVVILARQLRRLDKLALKETGVNISSPKQIELPFILPPLPPRINECDILHSIELPFILPPLPLTGVNISSPKQVISFQLALPF